MPPSDHNVPDVPKHSLMSKDFPTTPETHSPQLKGDKSSVLLASTCRNRTRPTRWKNSLKDEGVFAALCRWVVEHQIGNRKAFALERQLTALGLSANLLLLHALNHICFPRARLYTRKFHLLSYYNPRTGKYAAGWDDFYMVLYSIVVLTGLRAAIMDYVLMPIAQAMGVARSKERVRFAEQAWLIIYDSTMWSLGIVWTLPLRESTC